MNELQSFGEFDEGIRKVKKDSETWYAVVDVISLLIESKDPSKYWYAMKKRSDGQELSTICRKFPLLSPKNKRVYQVECADQKGLLRIIQSIPSPKAEPFKQWLAQVGDDRIKETTDPSKALDRVSELYEQLGYSKQWIALRVKNISVRNTLLTEWNNRNITDEEIIDLLNIIAKETFEMDIEEYRRLKGLTGEKLEDHMTDVELAISTLSEVSAAHIAAATNAQGYDQNKTVAEKSGRIGRNARLEIDRQSLGRNVISNVNYLNEPESEVRKRIMSP